MSRTIDSILDCHKIASTRRDAGIPIWDKKIDIKHVLRIDQSNTTPEHVTVVSKRIAHLLRSGLPKKYLDHTNVDFYEAELHSVIDDMENSSVEEFAFDAENGVSPVDMLNDWLTVIYDWADYNRVWLGS